MITKLADCIEAGKSLDADERLEAAHQLLLSVDHEADVSETDVVEAWEQTVARRVTELVSGTAAVVDGREGLARIRAALAERQG